MSMNDRIDTQAEKPAITETASESLHEYQNFSPEALNVVNAMRGTAEQLPAGFPEITLLEDDGGVPIEAPPELNLVRNSDPAADEALHELWFNQNWANKNRHPR